MGFMLAGHELQTGAEPEGVPEPSAHAVATAERAADEIALADGVLLISVEGLEALQAAADSDPLYIVDVRMPDDYLTGHIPGAINCPGGNFRSATTRSRYVGRRS